MVAASLIGLELSCTQSYSPPATRGSNNFLVVDGFINTGSDSTIFNLSNSVNLGDTTAPVPETGAQIIVEGSGGFSSPLIELGNGRYGTAVLNIDPNQQYRVRISTSGGNQYLSDYVSVLQTPAIDSISWIQQNQGVQIFVSTHDPLNLVNYYEWEFVETWEYRSYWNAELIYQNGMITGRLPSQQVYTCWNTDNSTNILVGSSANLNQHIIYEYPLISIPAAAVQLSVKYSILVKQLALGPDAYNYWESLKANTEELGSLFGPLPAEVNGNIQCLNKPGLAVLGYVSAGSLQQQRIYISNTQLNNWGYYVFCPDSLINSSVYFPKYYDQGYVPIYSVGLNSLYITDVTCADCTKAGGITTPPAFWQ
jgi:hypothetical protein